MRLYFYKPPVQNQSEREFTPLKNPFLTLILNAEFQLF